MTGAGTVGSPFMADGLSIVVGGTPANGDRFLVQPTANAIDGMDVLITDPSRVAAAAPIRTSVASTNLGTGTISRRRGAGPDQRGPAQHGQHRSSSTPRTTR